MRFLIEIGEDGHGEPVRMNLRLVDLAASEVVWSAAFAQDQAAPDPADFLDRLPMLLDSRVERHERRRATAATDGTEALDAMYWRANHLIRQWRREPTLEALRLTREVVRLQPLDDWARAQLALCEAITAAQAWADDPAAARERALEAARLCLSSGQEDPYALGTAAVAMVIAGGDAVAAESAIARALQINPDMPSVHFWLGWAILSRGDAARAAGHLGRALAMNPDMAVRPYALSGLGLCHLLLGDSRTADLMFAEAANLLEGFGPALLGAAACCALAGRAEEGRDLLARLDRAGGVKTALIILRLPEHRAMLAGLVADLRVR